MTPATARRPNTAHPMIRAISRLKAARPSPLIKGTRWICTPEAHSKVVRRGESPEPPLGTTIASEPAVVCKITGGAGKTAFVEYRPHRDPKKRAQDFFEVGVSGANLLHPEQFTQAELRAILTEHPRALGLRVIGGPREKNPLPAEVNVGKRLIWDDVGHEAVDFDNRTDGMHRRIEL